MATTADVVARVSRLASGQWGLFTAAQAEREAVTRSQLNRLVEAGVLERVERGVYATTSSTDENRALRAAWLALDPARTAEERLMDAVGAGVVSHTSAAGLHKLGDLLDDVPEVTYSHRKQTRRGIRVHRGDLTEADVTMVDGLPTTTEERTVADLLRDGHDPEHIAQIIGQGVRRGVIDLTDLARYLEPLARRYDQPDGQSLVAQLLDLVGLSPAALARDLAKSVPGQELLAAGRAAAFSQLIASILPAMAWASTPGIPSISADILARTNILSNIDFGKIAGFNKIAESMQWTDLATSQIAQIAEIAKAFPGPGAASILGKPAQSLQASTSSEEGRDSSEATLGPPPTHGSEETP
jgi:hypothetical protein